MKKLLKSAKEFAQMALSKKINNLKPIHYSMFLISKFMLLKESIIKKDSEHQIIYFNIKNNSQYLNAISIITDNIPRNRIIQLNNPESLSEVLSSVVLEDIPNNTPELDEEKIKEIKIKIWIFNKLRDCFGHGKYKLTDDNNILINNQGYIENVTIPLSLLESFNYISENPSPEKTIDAYLERIRELRKRFNYNSDNEIDLLYYKNYINNYKNNIYKNIPVDKKEKIFNNINNFDIYGTSLDEKKVITPNLSKKLIQIITEYALKILKEDEFTVEEKLKVVDLIEKTNNNNICYLDYKTINTLITEIESTHKNKQKVLSIIDEISTIISTSGNKDQDITISAIYNYTQLTMADVFDKIKEAMKGKTDNTPLEEKKKIISTLGHLKMRNFDFSPIIKNQDLNIIINNAVKEQVSFLKSKIDYYNNHKDLSQDIQIKLYEEIMRVYDNMNQIIITKLANRNYVVVESIRNAIEHGNILPTPNGKVELQDKTNQNASNTNFTCIVSPDDLYELTNSLEENNSEEKYTFEDFLLELKKVLDDDTYKALEETIKQINRIKLVVDLTQIKNKKSK